MQMLDTQQTANLLEFAAIEQTIDVGHAFIHIGKNSSGTPFVLVNDANGQSALTEGL